MENELDGSAFSIFSFRNKFTFRQISQKCRVFCSVTLFFSALVCSTVLFSALLYCSLLFCTLLCSVYFLAKKCPFLAKK